jgi:hypothetical protein
VVLVSISVVSGPTEPEASSSGIFVLVRSDTHVLISCRVASAAPRKSTGYAAAP